MNLIRFILFVILYLYFFGDANAEIQIGGITNHFIGNYNDYKYCLSKDCQLIANPMLGYRRNNDNIFIGLNSINKPMLGYRRNINLGKSNGFKFDLSVGAYYQNFNEFHKRNVNVLGYNNISPIIGFDISYSRYHFLYMGIIGIFYVEF